MQGRVVSKFWHVDASAPGEWEAVVRALEVEWGCEHIAVWVHPILLRGVAAALTLRLPDSLGVTCKRPSWLIPSRCAFRAHYRVPTFG